MQYDIYTFLFVLANKLLEGEKNEERAEARPKGFFCLKASGSTELDSTHPEPLLNQQNRIFNKINKTRAVKLVLLKLLAAFQQQGKRRF